MMTALKKEMQEFDGAEKTETAAEVNAAAPAAAATTITFELEQAKADLRREAMYESSVNAERVEGIAKKVKTIFEVMIDGQKRFRESMILLESRIPENQEQQVELMEQAVAARLDVERERTAQALQEQMVQAMRTRAKQPQRMVLQ